MKKILIATTILGMSAGFASAQVSFKGAASAGFASNGTVAGGKVNPTPAIASNATEFYSSFKLSVSAAGETDSGLTFGASASMTSGTTYVLADDDGFEAGAKTLGTPTVFIAGEFGKISFKQNGFKEFQDDNAEKYDVDYAGTFGGLSVGVRSDLNTVATNTAYNAATSGKSSIKLGYEVSGITLGAAYDEVGEKWGISAARAFGPVTATLATDDAEVTSLKLAYAVDAISASLKVDTTDDWKIAVGYAANGIKLDADTNQDSEWTVTAGYDLGGGLSLKAGTNYTEDMFVGAEMSF
jgi:outer membrane protein OmpU